MPGPGDDAHRPPGIRQAGTVRDQAAGIRRLWCLRNLARARQVAVTYQFHRSRRGPRAVIWSLAGELERAHRLPSPYKDAAGDVGLLSACRDVTIWYIQPLGHLLRWREAGTEVTWPAFDIDGAAARIATRCREVLPPADSASP